MQWLFLALAIGCEVGATISLRMATHKSNVWYLPVLGGYVLAFVFLSFGLNEGLGIGVAYGIWAAAGVALTAVASTLLFGEPFTRTIASGIGLIIFGVLLIELGAHH